MTQEDKQLLLKDLCARLPYEVICQMEDKLIINDSPFYNYTLSERHIELFRRHKGFYIKPYLRPMSSMTEEEKREYNNLCDAVPTSHYEFGDIVEDIELYDNFASIDWLNAHHFDYRGLISIGLAIKVTKENNPYEN